MASLILLTRIILHSATPPFVGSLGLPGKQGGSLNLASRDGLRRVSETSETLQSDAPGAFFQRPSASQWRLEQEHLPLSLSSQYSLLHFCSYGTGLSATSSAVLDNGKLKREASRAMPRARFAFGMQRRPRPPIRKKHRF